MSEIADIARETIARYALLPDDAPVLALVSGGADSVAVLRLLASGEFGERTVRVLHVDHALREDSARDAEWVRALCDTLHVPCRIERVDVAARAAAQGLNVEDAGRRVRYDLAEREADDLAMEEGIEASVVRIVTAHTRDDRAETLLMRLVDGAGPGGLSGLRAERGRVVRPLIDVRRPAIRAWLEEIGQTWLVDETNTDTDRQRAWVRHEVLPLLESANPAIVDAVARSAEVLAAEDALFEEMAQAFARDFELGAVDGRLPPSDDGQTASLVLDTTLLGTLTRPMARRVLRTAIAGRFPEASRIEFEHIEALVDSLGEDGFARDVTGGLRVRVECGRIVISRDGGPEAELEPKMLPVPGVVELGASGRIEAEVVAQPVVTDEPRVAWLDADSVSTPLTVGSLRAGDRIRPLGMAGTRPVADLLGEAGVAARDKPRVPVVRDSERVVWIAGVRLSDDCKIRPETGKAIRLSWVAENATSSAPET